MAPYEVRDNFLPAEYHQDLYNFFLTPEGPTCPWFYQSSVHDYGEPDTNPFDHYFVYGIYEGGVPTDPNLHESLKPFYELLNPKALVRVRALLYPNQTIQYAHGRHRDCPWPVKACVYYVNSNNGYTELDDGTRIESVANRALLFDGNTEHNSATCTDQKVRVVLNFNYF